MVRLMETVIDKLRIDEPQARSVFAEVTFADMGVDVGTEDGNALWLGESISGTEYQMGLLDDVLRVFMEYQLFGDGLQFVYRWLPRHYDEPRIDEVLLGLHPTEAAGAGFWAIETPHRRLGQTSSGMDGISYATEIYTRVGGLFVRMVSGQTT